MANKKPLVTEVGLEELADIFGCTERRIQQLQKDNQVVRIARGKYDLGASHRAIVGYWQKKAEEGPTADTEAARNVYLTEQRARAASALAEGREVSNARLRKQIVFIQDIQAFVDAAIGPVKAVLVAMPGRLAPFMLRLKSQKAAKKVLEGYSRGTLETLQNLSIDDIEIRDDQDGAA